MLRLRTRRIHWLVVSLIPLVTLLAYLIGRPARRQDAITPLVDSLEVLRGLADSCRTELDQGTAGFDDYDRRLDSLRTRVRDLEALDPRGVPADSYEVYLQVFEEYNDSVPGWTHRADSLRARWTHCRDLAETHNELADSVHDLLLKQLQEAERRRRR